MGMMGFTNAGVSPLNITAQTSQQNVASPASASAGYRLNNTGSALRRVAGTYTAISGQWLTSGTASSYDVRATVTSGALAGGTSDSTGAWLNLGTTRQWECVIATGPGTLAATLLIEIGLAGTSTALASATITLDAQST